MKKTILSVFALAMAFVATAEAQQKVFLNKGNKTIETVMLGTDDYIAFGRPVGVPEQSKVEIADLTAGKNYGTMINFWLHMVENFWNLH